MAASLMILTGHPSALEKSKTTQPRPRLYGSPTSLPCRTGPGYPMAATEYSQPAMALRTSATIFRGVIFGPEGISMNVLWPVAWILTWVPPTSRTRIFRGWFVILLLSLPNMLQPLLQFHGQRSFHFSGD